MAVLVLVGPIAAAVLLLVMQRLETMMLGAEGPPAEGEPDPAAKAP